MTSNKTLTILILILLIFKNFKVNKKLNSYKFKTLQLYKIKTNLQILIFKIMNNNNQNLIINLRMSLINLNKYKQRKTNKQLKRIQPKRDLVNLI